MADGTPQLGLIDYGQVKKLTKEQRHLFSRIIIALDDDDREKIVELMKEAGFKSERMDPEVIYVSFCASNGVDCNSTSKLSDVFSMVSFPYPTIIYLRAVVR